MNAECRMQNAELIKEKVTMAKRVFIIVLDSVGIGYAADAADFGDLGANTMKRVSASESFSVPALLSLGLGNIEGVDFLPKADAPRAAVARLIEKSRGKDTTTGHWEMMGIISERPMPTYPDGFPEELLAELREMGVGIYGTGGETADVGDLVRTIIVDSTVTCRMKRSDVIDNANIRPGDVIVGLSSTGQATYEKEYNGGMGSNGLTSARHDVFNKYLAEKYPESYDHQVPDELVYSGKYKLTDEVEGAPVSAGKLVLSPTRTYAPVVKKLLDEMRSEIHGMVHCTGGAQTKVLHFVSDNCKVVKDNMFPVPPLFRAIQEESQTDWSEMYKVFNMGHRLEVYVSPEMAEKVIEISKSFNIDAQIVGHIEEGKKSLTIKSEFGEFNY